MSSSGLSADEFVDGGSVRIAKLVGTLLGAVWVTVVSGWITVLDAIVRLHVVPLTSTARLASTVVRYVGLETASTAQFAWGEAFRAAVEANPLLAPLILSAEILLVAGLLLSARRRWF